MMEQHQLPRELIMTQQHRKPKEEVAAQHREPRELMMAQHREPRELIMPTMLTNHIQPREERRGISDSQNV